MKTLPLPYLLRCLNRWIYSCSTMYQIANIENFFAQIKEEREQENGWIEFENCVNQSIRLRTKFIDIPAENRHPKHRHAIKWVAELINDFKSPKYAC